MFIIDFGMHVCMCVCESISVHINTYPHIHTHIHEGIPEGVLGWETWEGLEIGRNGNEADTVSP